MFISKLELKNFKRFTDLTIDLSGENTLPKLVLMVGANGSGKSSVFDAFEGRSSGLIDLDTMNFYYKKFEDIHPFVNFTFADKPEIALWGDALYEKMRRAFYGRSAHRHVPQLTRQTVAGSVELKEDSDRPRRYIEFDQRFENDIAMLMRKMFTDFFGEQTQADALKKRYLSPINQALENIFGSDSATALKLNSLLPPIDGKPVEIFFSKGQVREIHYDLLSSGEKEIVNILFNLLNRREYYQDTIYYIDELDVHLNTGLQYNLIKEITENWIPQNCQLWTASHSLGFIQYAKEAEHAVILDFDQLDFDQPQTLTPQPKEVLEIYEVAVPKEIMFKVFQGKKIFLCENKNDEYYNLLGLDEKIFVGVQDKRQVYLNAKNNPAYFGLMDRDYLTESEMSKIRQQLPNLRILEYYAFENYLYHPENIAELFPDFDIANYQADIVRQKNEQRDYILTGLELARRGYSVLNDENIERDKNGIETIVTALQSDEIEKFYPYFDMKRRFNRHLVGALKLTPAKLAQTNWFKSAIGKILV